MELREEKKLAGTVKMPKSRWVCSSAKKVREAPACSKALQKNTTKKETLNMTATRCFSITLSDLSEKII